MVRMARMRSWMVEIGPRDLELQEHENECLVFPSERVNFSVVIAVLVHWIQEVPVRKLDL